MQARGFTLLEVTIVLVVGALLTTIGVVSAVQVIKESRYRADRARLYMDMKEARDKASNRLGGVWIQELSATRVNYMPVRDCVSRSPVPALPSLAVEYPAIDFLGDRGICYEGGSVSISQTTGGVPGPPLPAPVPGAPLPIDFIPMGGGPTDIVFVEEDGRLNDSWAEFPDEGAFEASPCDVDQDPNCGEEL